MRNGWLSSETYGAINDSYYYYYRLVGVDGFMISSYIVCNGDSCWIYFVLIFYSW